MNLLIHAMHEALRLIEAFVKRSLLHTAKGWLFVQPGQEPLFVFCSLAASLIEIVYILGLRSGCLRLHLTLCISVDDVGKLSHCCFNCVLHLLHDFKQSVLVPQGTSCLFDLAPELRMDKGRELQRLACQSTRSLQLFIDNDPSIPKQTCHNILGEVVHILVTPEVLEHSCLSKGKNKWKRSFHQRHVLQFLRWPWSANKEMLPLERPQHAP
mmetsp:Transcript_57145/g.124983  ORF Transcript_57145/g.124983 Transcript_57145/m.124983 type:complete len:212 (+) Transcript_57145:121-756(+)